MEHPITEKQIEFFKMVIKKYEPYPLDILNKIRYDENRYDENRLAATWAKKHLLEHGIDINKWGNDGTHW